MAMDRIIKSIALTPAVAAELERQAESIGLNISAYIRIMVAFFRDNCGKVRFDELGNRLELAIDLVDEKDTNTLI